MKRIAIYLTISHMAFSCGVGMSSLWKWYKSPPQIEQISDPVLTNTSTPVTPRRGVVFGDGLSIITHQVRMESERLRYKIDVSYPEIVGSKDLYIQNLNRHIKRLVTKDYEWTMNPSQADLRYYRKKWPDVFNTIHLDYEVRLATDSLLSIYFLGESYGIGAAHPVQYSFTVNYDLTLRKELELSDIFKPDSKYLEFIERYCKDRLAKSPARAYLFNDAFTRRTAAFESWNITRDGITFNFDECIVTACAAGEQKVEIPFRIIQPLLNPGAL